MQQMVTLPEPSAPQGHAVDIPAHDLLVSATDDRGVICHASQDLCRITRMSRDALLGAPHKVLRHRDMPRGLFHLMWARLRAGQPVCAYIRNATGDGNHYWAFTAITPTRDGFLSVAVRPQGDLFDSAQALYAAMLAEEAQGLAPEKSADWMLARLTAEGHPDFDSYACAALNAEYARRPDIDRAGDSDVDKIARLTGLMAEAEELSQKIIFIFQQVRGEPINLRILAGRLEGAGLAIGTISKNYETMAAEMYQMVERLRCERTGLLMRMRGALMHAQANAQVATLMTLAARQSAARPDAADTSPEGREMLQDQADALSALSRAAVAEVATLGKVVPDLCRQLRRRINGLDLVKLLCRVESGRMSDVDTGLTGIIARLELAHQETDRHLAALTAIALRIDTLSKSY